MRRLLLPLILLAGLISATDAGPLRLIDIIPNPGAASEETVFGRSLDWDDTEILVGAYPTVHVFDSKTREHKYRLGEDVTLVDGFAFGSKVVMTPNHFLTISSRVNRQQTIYVFRRSDGKLERTIPSPSGSNQEPGFGASFALMDNRLFVSILSNTPVGGTTAIGGVYVYDIRNWSQEPQVFRPADGERFDGFGNSISVEGNILAVGANRKGTSFQGAVCLFDATSRALIAKITGAVADGWYGTSVLLRNGKLYVTSRSSVWEYDAATGNYLGKFNPVPAAGYYDWFGSDVEVVGDDLLAVWSDNTLYQFDLGTRQQVVALRNPLDTGTAATRAGEMKARGDILLTGAAGGTDPGTKSGALLAFTKLAAEPVVEVSDATGSEAQRGVTVKVTNTHPVPVKGFRLHVDFSAYKAAYPSLRLHNASSPGNARTPIWTTGSPSLSTKPLPSPSPSTPGTGNSRNVSSPSIRRKASGPRSHWLGGLRVRPPHP